MSKAVKFSEYGGVDVLHVVEVQRPQPGPGEVVVDVVATAVNPGEIYIREGVFHEQWPATFPSGQGSDFAGRIADVGSGVEDWSVGDEVIGFTNNRGAQANFVLVDATQVIAKPPAVSWEVAGSLFVAGTTAYAAVRAVHPGPGETVVVSGAAGGVGSLSVQLAVNTGATVIGIAGTSNQEYLRSLGVVPVVHGDGVADRVRAAAPNGVDAFIDTFGSGYVELALELGVAPDRINTIIDFAAVATYRVKVDGNAEAASAAVLAELATMVASGELVVPIARTYPLDEVKAAYQELAQRHTRGKIVLIT